MKIKQWEKFQHFKDRRPPWIKLYKDLLDDPDWHELDSQSAKILVMLWLVASEDESMTGQLPCLRKLAFRFRISESDLNLNIQRLTHWLDDVDITTISPRYQFDIPETETEKKRDREEPTRKKKIDKPSEALTILKAEYPKRNGSQPWKAAAEAINARLKEGTSMDELRNATKQYARWCNAKGMTGTAYVMQAKRFYGPNREFEGDWTIEEPKQSRDIFRMPADDLEPFARSIGGPLPGIGETESAYRRRLQKFITGETANERS
jgi:hypothetical protein